MQLSGKATGGTISCLDGVGERGGAQGDERHHIDGAKPRVDTFVLGKVDALDDHASELEDIVDQSIAVVDEREHAPVVRTVAMHVGHGDECRRNRIKPDEISSFRDIDHALEHRLPGAGCRQFGMRVVACRRARSNRRRSRSERPPQTP